MKSLSELQIGETATVVDVQQNTSQAKQLESLGLVPGTVVTVRRCAPLGDPIQVNFRGYSLGMRRAEIDCVTVETNPA